MNSLKTVQMTSEELRDFLARGESKSRSLPSEQDPDVTDPENPDAADAIRALLDQSKRQGSGRVLVVTDLRRDADIRDPFRAIKVILLEWARKIADRIGKLEGKTEVASKKGNDIEEGEIIPADGGSVPEAIEQVPHTSPDQHNDIE